MNLMPEMLPDDAVLLKQMLVQMLSERQLDKGQIVDLKEQIKLLRDRLFGRKSEQTVETDTPQLALFNETESLVVLVTDESDEEVVTPTQRRGTQTAVRRPTAHRSHPRTARARTELRVRLS
ncbi:transposase domain-containing protein [Pseudomonas sp. ZS1P83]